MNTRTQIVSLCFLLALASSGCKRAEEESETRPVVEVKVANVEIVDLTLTTKAPANIFPREQASVAAPITARIVTLAAHKGESVTSGQVLATLENRDLLAQRAEAQAAINDAEANLQKTTLSTIPADVERARGQVEAARAALNQAQKAYDRRKDLFEKGAIPQRDLLLSETELTQARVSYDVARKALDLLETRSADKDIRIAQSHVDQARAKLQTIDAQLAFTAIRSPFAGVITEQMMYPGDMAKPDAPIFTIMDLSIAIARTQTPADTARTISKRIACSFSPAASGEAFSGRITIINQAVDTQRRTVEIWCEIPNATRRLKGGEFGTVSVITGTAHHSVVVPVAAVQMAEEGGKGTVVIVDAKNIAHLTEVETAETVDGKVRITSGLKGGETVVIEGGYSLPDGTKVAVKKTGSGEKDDEKSGKKEDKEQ